MIIEKYLRSALVFASTYALSACVAWDAPVPYPDYRAPSSSVPDEGNPASYGGSTSVVIPQDQDPPASSGGAAGTGGVGGGDPGFVTAGGPPDAGRDAAHDASVTTNENDGGPNEDVTRDAGAPP